ncbi:hypothetical protein ACWD4F_27705 [Streptomyces aureus]
MLAAECNNWWWGAAAVMSVFGKRRGRVAAVSGLAALALAQMVSDGVGKPLSDGPGLSEERIERDGFEERSPSSIFL